MTAPDKPNNLPDKIEWLIDNEGCEYADGLSGLQTFLSYCIHNDEIEQGIYKLIEDEVDHAFEYTWEEYEYEREQEEVAANRYENCADLIVSDMIGHGFIDGQNSDEQRKWIDRLTRTIKNHA